MIYTIKGFTFIEVILTLAIVIVIGVTTASVTSRFFFSQQTEDFFETFRSVVRKGQTYAVEGRNGSNWGVALRNNEIILFQGNSYDNREGSFDEIFPVPNGVTFSGFDEISIDQRTGIIGGTRESLTISGFGDQRDFFITREGALRQS